MKTFTIAAIASVAVAAPEWTVDNATDDVTFAAGDAPRCTYDAASGTTRIRSTDLSVRATHLRQDRFEKLNRLPDCGPSFSPQDSNPLNSAARLTLATKYEGLKLSFSASKLHQ